MHKRLTQKLDSIRRDPAGKDFILADAKDADMAWGIESPGYGWPAAEGRCRSMDEFYEQIRQIVKQGTVDIMLASVSTMGRLAHKEGLFEASDVTPAVRANDTTDVWCVRGGKYRERASLPFATCTLTEARFGTNSEQKGVEPTVNLGLYSMTLNNDLDADRESLLAFKEFRLDAARVGFQYFLEVFAPNKECGIPDEQIPSFVNDHIVRTLAGVPQEGRPEFLKIPYFGPRALEELVHYDSSMIVGILGGSSGTTYDAFKLLAEGQKYGARVALFGRKIKDAEDPLIFISMLRRIVDHELSPEEAVRAYHDQLKKTGIPPRRLLEQDTQLTTTELSYAR